MPIGVPEMVVILVIALVVLGPKRLPEAGRALGSGLREFKGGIAGSDGSDEAAPAPPALSSTTVAADMPASAAAAPFRRLNLRS
jgi:sec-independent protein translocase protein TatA